MAKLFAWVSLPSLEFPFKRRAVDLDRNDDSLGRLLYFLQLVLLHVVQWSSAFVRVSLLFSRTRGPWPDSRFRDFPRAGKGETRSASVALQRSGLSLSSSVLGTGGNSRAWTKTGSNYGISRAHSAPRTRWVTWLAFEVGRTWVVVPVPVPWGREAWHAGGRTLRARKLLSENQGLPRHHPTSLGVPPIRFLIVAPCSPLGGADLPRSSSPRQGERRAFPTSKVATACRPGPRAGRRESTAVRYAPNDDNRASSRS